MFDPIGKLAIVIFVGIAVITGIAVAGVILIATAPDDHHVRHMVVEQGHLTQSQVRHHEIRFDADTRECIVYDRAPNGDTLTIIVPNAMPTYEQKWGNPKGTIIECETRD